MSPWRAGESGLFLLFGVLGCDTTCARASAASQDILGGFALVLPSSPGCLEAIPSLPELSKLLRTLPALPAPSLPDQIQLLRCTEIIIHPDRAGN